MNDTHIKCHKISNKEEPTVDGKKKIFPNDLGPQLDGLKDNLNLARENEECFRE